MVSPIVPPAGAGFVCFTIPRRETFVGVCRAGPSEYRTSPRPSAALALLEALRIGAQLRHQVLGGAP
jgi:hypothetical protein